MTKARRFAGTVPLCFALLFCLVSAHVQAAICDRQGVLAPAARAILDEVASATSQELPGTWTLPTAAAFAHRTLQRPEHAERKSKAAIDHYRQLHQTLGTRRAARVMKALRTLQFVDAQLPPLVAVDHIVMNGSTAQSMRARWAMLSRAAAEGHLHLKDTTRLWMLDGERALFESESIDVLARAAPFEQDPRWRPPTTWPRDERELSEMIWAQLQLDTLLRAMPVTFVHTPAKPHMRRAHTADCVALWASREHPAAGVALIVSNNPFIEYQARVTEVLLAQHRVSDIEVFGMGAGFCVEEEQEHVALGMMLDAFSATLARAEQQRALGLFAATKND